MLVAYTSLIPPSNLMIRDSPSALVVKIRVGLEEVAYAATDAVLHDIGGAGRVYITVSVGHRSSPHTVPSIWLRPSGGEAVEGYRCLKISIERLNKGMKGCRCPSRGAHVELCIPCYEQRASCCQVRMSTQ